MYILTVDINCFFFYPTEYRFSIGKISHAIYILPKNAVCACVCEM